MKRIFCLILLVMGLSTAAQEVTTKYYDANWADTTKEKAAFYAVFQKSGTVYKCTSYLAKNNVVRGISTYPDTAFARPIGLQRLYFPNGNLEDSTVYDDNGKTKDSWHYYPNKVLAVHFYYPSGATEPVVEGYNEEGKRVKNYVLMREAAFKGGDAAWNAYLLKQISKEMYNTKDNTEVTVSVKVQFVVDESGYVTRPKVIESSGHRLVDGEALRVVMGSPQWSPSLLYNKPVKAFRVQPFTYTLMPPQKR